MLAGIYYGAMYGGSTTSILMNIPGESASVVTCIDGYQMTLKGRGGAALFISAWGSWLGGTLSIAGLMLLAPSLADFATKFGPPEMFAILLIAFILLGSLGSGSFFKTMPMVLLGLLVSTVGMDPFTGTLRFTHGINELFDGIGFIPVAMGALGIGEILKTTEESLVRVIHKVKLRELLPTRDELFASWGPIFRGSGIGFVIGLLPGSAHVLSSFISYIVEKRVSKRPQEFGTGRIEGVAGPETANNAASGSAMIPFLGFGNSHRPCAGRHDDCPDDSRYSTGPPFHLRTAPDLLGVGCEHVCRKYHLDHSEPAPCQYLRESPQGAFPHPFPPDPIGVPGRHLFDKFERL
jgi:putative tricarboxylic transport membrane protein